MPLQQIVPELPRDTRKQLLDVAFPSTTKFLTLYMILEYKKCTSIVRVEHLLSGQGLG